MALHVLNPDQLQFEFEPSAEVAKAAAATGFTPAPLKLTSQQLLFTRTAVLTGDNSAAALSAKRQEILEYFHQVCCLLAHFLFAFQLSMKLIFRLFLRPTRAMKSCSRSWPVTRPFTCVPMRFGMRVSFHHFSLLTSWILKFFVFCSSHPLIFYYGHTAVLYINKLITAKILTQRVNESYESMLAVGVDEMSWDDLSQTSYNWPSVAQVKQYRDRVRVIVDELIRTMPLQVFHFFVLSFTFFPSPHSSTFDILSTASHRLGEPLVDHLARHRTRAHPLGDVVCVDSSVAHFASP
jgi:hypothetical protein